MTSGSFVELLMLSEHVSQTKVSSSNVIACTWYVYMPFGGIKSYFLDQLEVPLVYYNILKHHGCILCSKVVDMDAE